MQRVFSTFPNGLPGAGLLLLRSAAGIGLLIQGAAYFADWQKMGFLTLAVAFLMIVSGACVLIGYLTPFAGVVAGLITMGAALSWFPAPNLDLFEARLTAVLSAIILAALVCLGPGAFSIDARRFGRREIVIPTAHSTES